MRNQITEETLATEAAKMERGDISLHYKETSEKRKQLLRNRPVRVTLLLSTPQWTFYADKA